MKNTVSDDLRPQVVLGIGAHPDDLDFIAGGTLAKFAAEGATVHYLILTDGSNGTADSDLEASQLVAMRRAEQTAAAEATGAVSSEFLSYKDGELEVTMALKKDIVRAIRTLKPDIVITFDPSLLYFAPRDFINHPDHRAAGQATLDAVFPLARDHLSFPDLYEAGYKPHKVKTVLLSNFEKQDFFIDITATITNKIAALAAHASQMGDMGQIEAMVRERAQADGHMIGVKYAEGFVRINTMA